MRGISSLTSQATASWTWSNSRPRSLAFMSEPTTSSGIAFVPFESVPNLPWNDPNLKFLDLTGDGHADILITENDAFTWYPSLAEEGFGTAIRIPKPRDEEQGPAVVFADGDPVHFRCGHVRRWPHRHRSHPQR